MLIIEHPDPFDVRDMCTVMLRANKIWITAGAGISVSCGIPDFRSDKGLFVKAKEAAPWLESGQDMFHKDRLKNAEERKILYSVIENIHKGAKEARPSAFHKLVYVLQKEGKLGRLYSQNIDELEESIGLDCSVDASGSVLLLHGRAGKVYCEDCHSEFPLDEHIEALRGGLRVPCPACTRSASPDRSAPSPPLRPHSSTSESTSSTNLPSTSTARKTHAREPRRSSTNVAGQKGNLRTSTLLYGEVLPNDEEVRKEIERDIKRAKRGDIILIVGTTLHIRQAREIVMKLHRKVRYPKPEEDSYDKDTMYWINPTLPDDVLEADMTNCDKDRVPVDNYTLLPANHFAAVLLGELRLKAKGEGRSIDDYLNIPTAPR